MGCWFPLHDYSIASPMSLCIVLFILITCRCGFFHMQVMSLSPLPLSQLVAGSVVMAFETVCPERTDLIHKNYRKLCNLLVDVDEWGQVMILSMLTRYARSQFVDPNKEVSHHCAAQYLHVHVLACTQHVHVLWCWQLLECSQTSVLSLYPFSL